MKTKRTLSFRAQFGVMAYRYMLSVSVEWCLNQNAHSAMFTRNKITAGFFLPYQASSMEMANSKNKSVIMVLVLSGIRRKTVKFDW